MTPPDGGQVCVPPGGALHHRRRLLPRHHLHSLVGAAQGVCGNVTPHRMPGFRTPRRPAPSTASSVRAPPTAVTRFPATTASVSGGPAVSRAAVARVGYCRSSWPAVTTTAAAAREQTGQACSAAVQCYPGIDQTTLRGAVECLKRAGWLLHPPVHGGHRLLRRAGDAAPEVVGGLRFVRVASRAEVLYQLRGHRSRTSPGGRRLGPLRRHVRHRLLPVLCQPVFHLPLLGRRLGAPQDLRALSTLGRLDGAREMRRATT